MTDTGNNLVRPEDLWTRTNLGQRRDFRNGFVVVMPDKREDHTGEWEANYCTSDMEGTYALSSIRRGFRNAADAKADAGRVLGDRISALYAVADSDAKALELVTAVTRATAPLGAPVAHSWRDIPEQMRPDGCKIWRVRTGVVLTGTGPAIVRDVLEVQP